MGDDLEEALLNIASVVYERVKQFGIGDRAYERAMCEELLDRGIRHEAHKRVYDERKGKYKFIDLFFPDNARFAKLKARKYITRTELAELKEEEQAMGIEGLIINFYNGVSIRHSTSGRIRASIPDYETSTTTAFDAHRHQKRMTLPHLSGSTSHLSDIGEPTFGPSRHTSNKYNKYPVTVPPLTDDREGFRNANKIFSVSCAAFFLSEGNRRQFAAIFNDLLESMKMTKISIPEKFLEGPKLSTPDGELSHALKKVIAKSRKLGSETSNSPANSHEE